MQNLKNAIYDFFRDAAIKMNATLAHCCEPYGLTNMQSRVLLEAGAHPGQTVGELGRNLSMSSGNISAMLKTLERKGLVSRERSPGDERMVRVSLTDEGGRILQRLDGQFEEAFERMLSHLSEEERGRLLESLTQLGKLFAECGAAPPRQEE